MYDPALNSMKMYQQIQILCDWGRRRKAAKYAKCHNDD